MCFRHFYTIIMFEKRIYVFINRYKFYAIDYFEINTSIIVDDQTKTILYIKIRHIIKNVIVFFDVEIEYFENL